MDAFRRIEKSFSSFERLLGISITLIDCGGSLHTPAGRPLFPATRQTHQKNSACKTGFCHKCIEHCRYEMIKKSSETPDPYFFHHCWKGLMEVTAPIRQGEMLIGLLYGGIWRAPRQARSPHSVLPPSAVKAANQLSEFNESHAHMLGSVLALMAKGIAAELSTSLPGQVAQRSRRDIIREFIFTHAAVSPRLGNLSKKLGLSASRTSHLVRELFGKSYEELLIGERISRAKTLLQNTELPIYQISELTGFPDNFSFSKTFKRLEGRPPSEFRRNIQVRQNA